MNWVVRFSLIVAAMTVALAEASTALAQVDPTERSGDVCWNYWLIPCPDDFDFYWRPATTFSPRRPVDWDRWASVVAPIETSFFLDPMPHGRREEHNYALAGWGYEWTVVPVNYWRFGDDNHRYGQAATPSLESTAYRYERSSYGQSHVNPRGEPAYDVRGVVAWFGVAWEWHWECSPDPPMCAIVRTEYPMGAWKERRHPVVVRQILPIVLGY